MSFKNMISMLRSVALFAVSFAESTSNYKDYNQRIIMRHSKFQSPLKGSKKNIRGAASLPGITKLTSKSFGSYSPSGWLAFNDFYNSTTCDGVPTQGVAYIPMGVCVRALLYDNDDGDDDGVIGSEFDTIQDQGSNLVLTALYYKNSDCSGSPVKTVTETYAKTCVNGTTDYGEVKYLYQYFPGSSVPNSPYLQGVSFNECLDSTCNETILIYAVNPTYCWKCDELGFDPSSCNASTWYKVQSVNGVPLYNLYADAQCTASTGTSPATVNCSPNPYQGRYWYNYYTVLPSV